MKRRNCARMRRTRVSLLVLLLSLCYPVISSAPSASAAFPGDNGLLIFHSDTGIYSMNSRGGNIKELASIDSDGGDPAWSPDGTKIAYERSGDIFVMNTDGSGKTRLTTSAVLWETDPAWSPDGTKILFTSEVLSESGRGDIAIMNSDGTGQMNFQNGGDLDGYPAWSPDGSKIAFSGFRDGVAGIFVTNSDGSEVTNLTDHGVNPNWSPDGTTLVFESDTDDNDPVYYYAEIYVVNLDGTGETRLTNNSTITDENPVWSPDGSRILFSSTRSAKFKLYTMDPDGSDVTAISTPKSYAPRGSDWQPLWLTFGASQREIDFGRSVTLTAHLTWFETTDNRMVSIYGKPHGGTERLIATGEVDGVGNFTAEVSPKKNSTYFAQWSGDDEHFSTRSPDIVIRVHAITTAKLLNFYSTSRMYKLYHKGQRVTVRGKVVPNHAGKKLHFKYQKKAGGTWRTQDEASFPIQPNGTATVFLRSRYLETARYRQRATFKGDADHLGDASQWVYFGVTR